MAEGPDKQDAGQSDSLEGQRTAKIKVLPDQPNPASWCRDYIGQVFDCYWFPLWGCWRIKDWTGRWDCTFQKGYQAFEILEASV